MDGKTAGGLPNQAGKDIHGIEARARQQVGEERRLWTEISAGELGLLKPCQRTSLKETALPRILESLARLAVICLKL